MTSSIPNLTLNNGIEMPALGYGVSQTPPAETVEATSTALRAGYRHIDTAAAYGNEREVGEAIRASGIPRAEIFVETKVWIGDYGYDATRHAFDKSAGKQGRSAIPKSVRPSRTQENLAVGDFEQSGKELARIDALDTGVRGGPDPTEITLEAFGRDIPEA